MRTLAALIVILPLLVMGCAPNTEPLERLGTKGFDVMNAALDKASIELSSRTAQLIGGGQAIEPGYVVKFSGKIVNGFEGEAQIYLRGIAAQLQAATQQDAGQEGVLDLPRPTNDSPEEN